MLNNDSIRLGTEIPVGLMQDSIKKIIKSKLNDLPINRVTFVSKHGERLYPEDINNVRCDDLLIMGFTFRDGAREVRRHSFLRAFGGDLQSDQTYSFARTYSGLRDAILIFDHENVLVGEYNYTEKGAHVVELYPDITKGILPEQVEAIFDVIVPLIWKAYNILPLEAYKKFKVGNQERTLIRFKSELKEAEIRYADAQREAITSMQQQRNVIALIDRVQEPLDEARMLKDIELIGKHPKVNGLKFMANRIVISTIALETKPLPDATIRLLGEYDISFYPESSPLIFNKTRTIAQKHHPHGTSLAGDMCWGNLTEGIIQLSAAQDIHVMTNLIIDFLENGIDPTDTYGKRVYLWPIKDGTEPTFDVEVKCSRCDELIEDCTCCPDCGNRNVDCSEELCERCDMHINNCNCEPEEDETEEEA